MPLPKITIETLFDSYCKTAGHDIRKMEAHKVIAIRQAFYSGAGMLLMLQRDTLGKVPRGQRDVILSTMLKECEEYNK